MIADSESVLYNNPVNVRHSLRESRGQVYEELVVLVSGMVLVLLTPSSPWTNGECWETPEHLGDLNLSPTCV